MSFAVIFTLYCSFSAALSWEMGIKHTLLRFRTSLPIPRFLSKTPKSTATWPMTVLSFSKSNESMFMLWWLSPSSFSYIWVDRGIPMYSEPSTTIRWFSFFSNTFSEEASESSTGRCHGDRCCCAGWTWKRATHKKRVSHHAYVGRKSREVDARKSRRHLGMHTAFEKRYKSSSDPRSSRHLTSPTISSDLPNLRQIRVCSASLSLPKSSTIAANVRHKKKEWNTSMCLPVVFACRSWKCRNKMWMRPGVWRESLKHEREASMLSSDPTSHYSKVYLAVQEESPKSKALT